jgi:CHAT domain-containing protein
LRGPSLEPLPGTRREVEALAHLFGSRKARVVTLLGAEASEARLEALAHQGEGLKAFRWLHLATHGYADARGGMNSYLALAAPAADAPAGRLTAGHILRGWKLDADLAVLSACQTGLGEHRGGEGYVGFAQALLLAGARSVALSLWSVDDNATALLMIRFYGNLLGARAGLKGPLPRAAALAEAKQWLRGLGRDEAVALVEGLGGQARQVPRGQRPYAHPNYWAAFVLIGDPGRDR